MRRLAVKLFTYNHDAQCSKYGTFHSHLIRSEPQMTSQNALSSRCPKKEASFHGSIRWFIYRREITFRQNRELESIIVHLDGFFFIYKLDQIISTSQIFFFSVEGQKMPNAHKFVLNSYMLVEFVEVFFFSFFSHPSNIFPAMIQTDSNCQVYEL